MKKATLRLFQILCVLALATFAGWLMMDAALAGGPISSIQSTPATTGISATALSTNPTSNALPVS